MKALFWEVHEPPQMNVKEHARAHPVRNPIHPHSPCRCFFSEVEFWRVTAAVSQCAASREVAINYR